MRTRATWRRLLPFPPVDGSSLPAVEFSPTRPSTSSGSRALRVRASGWQFLPDEAEARKSRESGAFRAGRLSSVPQGRGASFPPKKRVARARRALAACCELGSRGVWLAEPRVAEPTIRSTTFIRRPTIRTPRFRRPSGPAERSPCPGAHGPMPAVSGPSSLHGSSFSIRARTSRSTLSKRSPRLPFPTARNADPYENGRNGSSRRWPRKPCAILAQIRVQFRCSPRPRRTRGRVRASAASRRAETRVRDLKRERPAGKKKSQSQPPRAVVPLAGLLLGDARHGIPGGGLVLRDIVDFASKMEKVPARRYPGRDMPETSRDFRLRPTGHTLQSVFPPFAREVLRWRGLPDYCGATACRWRILAPSEVRESV